MTGSAAMPIQAALDSDAGRVLDRRDERAGTGLARRPDVAGVHRVQVPAVGRVGPPGRCQRAERDSAEQPADDAPPAR